MLCVFSLVLAALIACLLGFAEDVENVWNEQRVALIPAETQTTAVLLGASESKSLAAWQFWRTSVHVNMTINSIPVMLNVSTTVSESQQPSHVTLGVYARRHRPPTHVRYHWLHVLHTARRHVTMTSQHGGRRRRQMENKAGQLSVRRQLESGIWYIYLYNDSPSSQTVTLSITPLTTGRQVSERNESECDCRLTESCIHSAQHTLSPPTTTHDERCESRCKHGQCVSGQCQPGWTGDTCDVVDCDSSHCHSHGTCQNGSCLCHQGWTGPHCVLRACSCGVHGRCADSTDEPWSCTCHHGWTGSSCQVAAETDCHDDVDNDADGLTDCSDVDCCSDEACINSVHCRAAPHPLDILLRKQAPSSTASFYDHVKFLIDDDSVQSYASSTAFQRRRVSVVRGRVVDVHGVALVGVRVSVITQPLYGFTLTRRHDAQYDLLVNGGGAVVVVFQKPPYVTQHVNVLVPWNRFVVLDTVTLLTANQQTPPDDRSGIDHCNRSNVVRPEVVFPWQPLSTLRPTCSTRSNVLLESQVLEESLRVPGTEMYLIYVSSRAEGFMSTLLVRLTPTAALLPDDLTVVHVQVIVEGLVKQQVLTAQPSLSYLFTWHRRNVYNQKVYGLAAALVRVGYEYRGCEKVFWQVLSSTIPAYDIASSQIAGWNFNIHHTYNFRQGIVHKGDGSNIYTRLGHVMMPLLGDSGRRLVGPVSLATAPDGTVYIGDLRFIGKLTTAGDDVIDVIALNASRWTSSAKYFMCVSPVDSSLYISDDIHRQVLRLSADEMSRRQPTVQLVAGSGQPCARRQHCGDEGRATDAQLSHPKGLAVDVNGVLYMADGVTIRTVDKRGHISTLIGSQSSATHWRPLLCSRTRILSQVTLQWPTSLAINPVDQSLYILDTDMVIRLSTGHQLTVVIATSTTPCLHSLSTSVPPVTVSWNDIHDMAFTPDGQIVIAQQRQLRAIDLVSSHVTDYIDLDIDDCRLMTSSRCHNTSLSAVAVGHDGVIYVTDVINARLYTVTSPLPSAHHVTGNYKVKDATTQQLYTFNRYGQHISTHDLLTGTMTYKFTYNVNSYYGRLLRVYDLPAAQSVLIRRDYRLHAQHLTVTSALPGARRHSQSERQQRCHVTTDSNGLLASLTTPLSVVTRFSYGRETGLLASKEASDGDGVSLYQYSSEGRVVSVINRVGVESDISSDVDDDIIHVSDACHGSQLRVTGRHLLYSMMRGDVLSRVESAATRFIIELAGNKTVTYRSMSKSDDEFEMLWSVSHESTVSNRVVWRYKRSVLQRRHRVVNSTIHRQLTVNGRDVLSVLYQLHDNATSDETLFNDQRDRLLHISFNHQRLPITMTPLSLASVHVAYDVSGHVTWWQRGDVTMMFVYDDVTGQLREWTQSNQRQTLVHQYLYAPDSHALTELILPSGKRFEFIYDNSSRLTAVITPSQHQHRFQRLLLPGIARTLYQAPHLNDPLIADYDSHGRLVSLLYPKCQRHVTYDYSADGRDVDVMYDSSHVRYRHTSVANYTVTSSSVEHDDVSCSSVIERSENASMTSLRVTTTTCTRHHGRHDDVDAVTEALYVYRRDVMGRVESVESVIGGHQLPVTRFSYSQDSGQLQHASIFTCHHSQRDVGLRRHCVTDDGHVDFSRDYDAFSRLSRVVMSCRRHVIFTLQLWYDTLGRLTRWSAANTDNNPLTLTVNYLYDVDGNVVAVNRTDLPVTWHRDGDDVIDHVTDGDGLVVRRGIQRLVWNSRAQLTSVSTDDVNLTYYDYDADGRLSAVNSQTSSVQLYYGDLDHPRRITHIHNSTSHTVTELFYDPVDGHLLAVRQNGTETLYVVVDPHGSPLALYNASGHVTHQMHYTPHGRVFRHYSSTQSDRRGWLIGYAGGFLDTSTGLLFYDSHHVLDPDTGRWLAPNYDAFIGNDLYHLISVAYRSDLYEANLLRHGQFLPPSLGLQLSDWLPSLGYAYENLVQPITIEQAGVTGSRSMTSQWTACVHDVWSRQFASVQLTTQLGRLDQGLDPARWVEDGVRLTTRPYLFGGGVLISTSCCDCTDRALRVHLLDTADDNSLSQLAVLLLNNSLLVSTYYSPADRRQMHHYVKASASSVQLYDVMTDSVTDVTITIDRTSHDDVDVSVINDVSELHVRLVSRQQIDLEAERRRVRRLVQR